MGSVRGEKKLRKYIKTKATTSGQQGKESYEQMGRESSGERERERERDKYNGDRLRQDFLARGKPKDMKLQREAERAGLEVQ